MSRFGGAKRFHSSRSAIPIEFFEIRMNLSTECNVRMYRSVRLQHVITTAATPDIAARQRWWECVPRRDRPLRPRPTRNPQNLKRHEMYLAHADSAFHANSAER